MLGKDLLQLFLHGENFAFPFQSLYYTLLDFNCLCNCVICYPIVVFSLYNNIPYEF